MGFTHLMPRQQQTAQIQILYKFSSFFKIFFSFNLFISFRVTPAAHGGSQARGLIRELKPWAYTTATATQDPSCIWDLRHSSWQHRILNSLGEAGDQIKSASSWMLVGLINCRATTVTPINWVLMKGKQNHKQNFSKNTKRSSKKNPF